MVFRAFLTLFFLFVSGIVLADEKLTPSSAEVTPLPPESSSGVVLPPSPRFEMMKEAMKSDEDRKYEAWAKAMKLAAQKKLLISLSVDAIAQIKAKRASVLTDTLCMDRNLTRLSRADFADDKNVQGVVSILENIQSTLTDLCNAISTFADNYLLTITLKNPYKGIETLKYHVSTLESAMIFIRSVQEGRIGAVLVQSHQPKDSPEPGSKPLRYELEACKECTIIEWMFRLDGKR